MPPKLTPAQTLQIQSLYRRGWTLQEIAQRFSVSIDTVARHVGKEQPI